VHLQRWPTFDPELVRAETVTMVVQVNGKLRDKVEVSPEISEAEAKRPRWPRPRWSRRWPGRCRSGWWPKPPRLVNVVV
jgi:leucyl-tRNA synthetase